MSKLSEDANIGILGAAAGLFSSSVTLLIARIDTYYAWLRESDYAAYGRIEDLWWVPVSAWHIILSVVASLLIHRYLTNSIRSPFLLWQVVGITSLFGWASTFVLVVTVGCIMRGRVGSVENLPRLDEVLLVGKYVATVFACNVFYGAVMNASSRQYVEGFDLEG